MGQYIHVEGMTTASYLDQMVSQGDSTMVDLLGQALDKSLKTVAQRSPLGLQLAEMLALVSPDAIPLRFIVEVCAFLQRFKLR